jgi:hypothetical protein
MLPFGWGVALLTLMITPDQCIRLADSWVLRSYVWDAELFVSLPAGLGFNSVHMSQAVMCSIGLNATA